MFLVSSNVWEIPYSRSIGQSTYIFRLHLNLYANIKFITTYTIQITINKFYV